MKYVISNFGGGFSDVDGYGIKGAFKNTSKNLNIRKTTDSLSCNQALKEETPPSGGFDSLIDWFVPSSDGNIYGFCRNGKILKRTSAGVWTLVYTDTDGQIYGAWEWGIANGKKYMFWATATKLKSKEIPGNATWATDTNANIVVGSTTYTWPKSDLTTPVTGFNHMMKGIGGGVGALAICNDETLAFVGYDGSYTNEILRFTPGNSSKALLQRGNNVVMGTVAKNQLVQTALFLWDGTDTEEAFGWDDIKPLPLQDITAMIDTEVPLLVDGKGQVFYSDFTSSQPLFTFPDSGKVSAGGVTNEEYIALFGVWDNGDRAGIYSYGRKWKNASLVPNLEYQITCTEIGAIIKSGDELLVSYNNNGTYGVKNIDTENKAEAIYTSIDLPKPNDYPSGKIPNWGNITLHTEPLPTGCSIACKYRMNKNGVFKDANLGGGATSFSTTGAQEATFLVGDFGQVSELQLVLTPSGNETPEVRSIEWEFK